MNKELMNLFLFIGILFVLYLIFRGLNFRIKEGMTDGTTNNDISQENGIANNAATYGANIKATNIKYQDQLLITKYRKDYETAIINIDDLINNLMLNTVLSINSNKPDNSIKKLVELNQAKTALNEVMKFVDKQ